MKILVKYIEVQCGGKVRRHGGFELPITPYQLATRRVAASLLLALSLLVVSSTLGCFSSKSASEPDDKNAVAKNIGPKPFGIGENALPRGFSAHDPRPIIDGLNSALLHRGKFEKRADWEARLQKWSGTKFMGDLSPHSVLAFRPESISFSDSCKDGSRTCVLVLDLSPTYELVQYAGIDHLSLSDIAGRNAVILQSQKSNRSDTGMPVAVREDYDLAIVNSGDLKTLSGQDVTWKQKYSWGGHELDIKVPVPADVTNVTDRLALLLIAAAEEPYVTRTEENPHSVSGQMVVWNTTYLHGRLLQIWAYDSQTGKVFAKVSLPQKAYEHGDAWVEQIEEGSHGNLSVVTEKEYTTPAGYVTPRLTIVCDELLHDIKVNLYTGDPLSQTERIPGRAEWREVNVFVDGKHLSFDKWARDGPYLYTSETPGLVRKLSRADSVSLQVEDMDQDFFTFRVAGLNKHLPKLIRACRAR
jgi:hypothetical protein